MNLNIEIKQVANGFMVRPAYRSDTAFIPDEKIMVFNKLEDLFEYIRTLSGASK